MKYIYMFLLCLLCLVSNAGCCSDEKQDKKKIALRVALLEKTLQCSAHDIFKLLEVLDLEKIGILPAQTKEYDVETAHSPTLGNIIKNQQEKLAGLKLFLGPQTFKHGLEGKSVTVAIEVLYQRYCQTYAVLKNIVEQKNRYKSELSCMQDIVKQLEIASMRQAEEIARQKDLLEKMAKFIDLDNTD